MQLRVHNVGKIPVKNVGVKLYARHLDSPNVAEVARLREFGYKRTLIASTIIPEIGIEVRRLEEGKTESNEHKVINGAKYPMARHGNTSIVFLTRALVDATWTPSQPGYYQLEVELQPSEQYTIRGGLAKRMVPVGE